MTVARLVELTHQSMGQISKSMTPLELAFSGSIVRENAVLLLSAGGDNPDILSICRIAAEGEPRSLIALCMTKDSPLSKLKDTYQSIQAISFDPPVKKDGFLATNSLVAFSTILLRAYSEIESDKLVLPQSITDIRPQSIEREVVDSRDTWLVLYAGWGSPAATDLESKLFEGALGNVSTVDYRNFAHGRHNWLANRGNKTTVVALITPQEREIAEKTLKLIPESTHVERIESDYSGPISSLDLIVKSMFLVNEIGSLKGIDPGRPRVQDFGRRLYHLNVVDSINSGKPSIRFDIETAVFRKMKIPFNSAIDDSELEYWVGAYERFIKKLGNAKLKALVLDYDGTICSPDNRYSGPSEIIVGELCRLIDKGMIVGIATGRGSSVGTKFREMIREDCWDSIIIGYYNGSDIAQLNDSRSPNRTNPVDKSFSRIIENLENNEPIRHVCDVEVRPKQISLELKDAKSAVHLKRLAYDAILKSSSQGVKILESSHSIDILAPGVSKVSLVDYIADHFETSAANTLCIGDRGEWPGNDYELLSMPLSLSVDTVSSDANSCWNIGKRGTIGVQTTIDYLRAIRQKKSEFSFITQ